jgi:RNA polymerase sigma-70 factor (ECF subfamily)
MGQKQRLPARNPPGRNVIVHLSRIRSGDVEALNLLMREAWAPLVTHLATLVGSGAAAQDAAQEAFVRLWEHRERWESGSARAVLFRIGRNVALDERRRAEVRRRWALSPSAEPPSRVPTPGEELEAAEFADRFWSALEDLPPRRREVFELVRFGGLSYAEAAHVMDLSEQTVANQMSRALKALRHLLAGFLSDADAAGAGRGREAGVSDG